MNSKIESKRIEMLKNLLETKKLIVFDCDGTLLDSMSMWEHIGTDYVLSQGLIPPEDMEEKLVSMTLEQSGQYLIQELGLQKTLDEFIKDIYAFVDKCYRYELELKPGAKEFVQKMAEWGKKMCILTTTGRPNVEAAMKRCGIDAWISANAIYTCTELQMSKTKPDVYRRVTELMGADVSETLVFEDAPFAIENAKLAGCSVVAVYDRTAETREEVIGKYADWRIQNFEEICETIASWRN